MKAAPNKLELPIFCQSNSGSKWLVLPSPNKMPRRMIPRSAPIFRIVKIFCVTVPCLTPKQCSPDKSNTTPMENSVPILTVIGISGSGNREDARLPNPSTGKKNDIKPFKITERNAMAPEKVTRNEDQPERNPISLP